MDKTERVLFEAHAILQAHAELMLALVRAPFEADYVANMRKQIEMVDVAHKAFLALPWPAQQQRAA